jgi:hypothetical protein
MFATSVPAADVTAAVAVVLLTTVAAAVAVCEVVVSKVQAGIEAVVASVHCVSVTHTACHWWLVAWQHLVLLELLELLCMCVGARTVRNREQSSVTDVNKCCASDSITAAMSRCSMIPVLHTQSFMHAQYISLVASVSQGAAQRRRVTIDAYETYVCSRSGMVPENCLRQSQRLKVTRQCSYALCMHMEEIRDPLWDAGCQYCLVNGFSNGFLCASSSASCYEYVDAGWRCVAVL